MKDELADTQLERKKTAQLNIDAQIRGQKLEEEMDTLRKRLDIKSSELQEQVHKLESEKIGMDNEITRKNKLLEEKLAKKDQENEEKLLQVRAQIQEQMKKFKEDIKEGGHELGKPISKDVQAHMDKLQVSLCLSMSMCMSKIKGHISISLSISLYLYIVVIPVSVVLMLKGISL